MNLWFWSGKSKGSLVQLVAESPTVLGQDQVPPPPQQTLETVPLAIPGEIDGNDTNNVVTGVSDGGTLSQLTNQSNNVKGFPTWAIILISLLGGLLVFSVIGVIGHKIGVRNRTARARRWVNNEQLNQMAM